MGSVSASVIVSTVPITVIAAILIGTASPPVTIAVVTVLSCPPGLQVGLQAAEAHGRPSQRGWPSFLQVGTCLGDTFLAYWDDLGLSSGAWRVRTWFLQPGCLCSFTLNLSVPFSLIYKAGGQKQFVPTPVIGLGGVNEAEEAKCAERAGAWPVLTRVVLHCPQRHSIEEPWWRVGPWGGAGMAPPWTSSVPVHRFVGRDWTDSFQQSNLNRRHV